MWNHTAAITTTQFEFRIFSYRTSWESLWISFCMIFWFVREYLIRIILFACSFIPLFQFQGFGYIHLHRMFENTKREQYLFWIKFNCSIQDSFNSIEFAWFFFSANKQLTNGIMIMVVDMVPTEVCFDFCTCLKDNSSDASVQSIENIWQTFVFCTQGKFVNGI